MQNKKLLSVFLALVLVATCAIGMLMFGANAEERTDVVTWTVGTDYPSLAEALAAADEKTDWSATQQLVIVMGSEAETATVDADGILFGLHTIFDTSGARLPITIQGGTLELPADEVDGANAIYKDVVCANSYTFKDMTFPIADHTVYFYAGSGEVVLDNVVLSAAAEPTKEDNAKGYLFADCPVAAAFEGWSAPAEGTLIDVSLHLKGIDFSWSLATKPGGNVGAVHDTDGFTAEAVSASDLAVELILTDSQVQEVYLRSYTALSPIASLTFTVNDTSSDNVSGNRLGRISGIGAAWNNNNDVVFPDFDYTININGGTVEWTSNFARGGGFTGDYTVNIAGGHFKNEVETIYGGGSGYVTGDCIINVTGGTFDSNFFGTNGAVDGYKNENNISGGTFSHRFQGTRVAGDVVNNISGSANINVFCGTYNTSGGGGTYNVVNNISGGTIETYYGTGGINADDGTTYTVDSTVNNMTGGQITGNFYGAGCVKNNNYIENNLAGTEILGNAYGSKNRGTDKTVYLHVVVNNLSASVIHGNFVGNYSYLDGVNDAVTDADGTYNVKNKVTGGEIKGEFIGCSDATVNGSLLNVITGGELNTRTQLSADNTDLDTPDELNEDGFSGAKTNTSQGITNKISGGNFYKGVKLTDKGNSAPTVVNEISGGKFGIYAKSEVYVNADGTPNSYKGGRCHFYAAGGTHDTVTTTYAFPDNKTDVWGDNHYGVSGTVGTAINYYYGVCGQDEFYGSDGKITETKNYVYGETAKGPGFYHSFQGSAGCSTAGFQGKVYNYVFGGEINVLGGIDGKNNANVGTVYIENNIAGGSIADFRGGARRGEVATVVNNISGDAVITTYYGATAAGGFSANTAPDMTSLVTNNIGTETVDAEKAQLGAFTGNITTFYGGRRSAAAKKDVPLTIVNNFVNMGEKSEIDVFYGGSAAGTSDVSITNNAIGTAGNEKLVRIDSNFYGGGKVAETAPVVNNFTYARFGFDLNSPYHGGGAAGMGDITNNMDHFTTAGNWVGGSVTGADGVILNEWTNSTLTLSGGSRWWDGSNGSTSASVTNNITDSDVAYFRGCEAASPVNLTNNLVGTIFRGSVWASHHPVTGKLETIIEDCELIASYVGLNGTCSDATTVIKGDSILHSTVSAVNWNMTSNAATLIIEGGTFYGDVRQAAPDDRLTAAMPYAPEIILAGDITVGTDFHAYLTDVATPEDGKPHVITMGDDGVWNAGQEYLHFFALGAEEGTEAEVYEADMANVVFRNLGTASGYVKKVDNTFVGAAFTDPSVSMNVEERVTINLYLPKADVDSFLETMVNSEGENAFNYYAAIELADDTLSLGEGVVNAENKASLVSGDFYKVRLGAISANDFDKEITIAGSAFSVTVENGILEICETGIAAGGADKDLDLFTALYNYGASQCIDPATDLNYEAKEMSAGFAIVDDKDPVAILVGDSSDIAFNYMNLLMGDAVGIRFKGVIVDETAEITMTINGNATEAFYTKVVDGQLYVDIFVSADNFEDSMVIGIYTDGNAALQVTTSVDGYVEQVMGMGDAEYAMAQLVQACINKKA